MSEKIDLDCRGMACPHPVINTKKALDSISEGTVTTLVDNDTARENVTLFAKNAGHGAIVEKEGRDYKITITKGRAQAAGERPAGPVPSAEKAGHGIVYFITSNMLGQGSPDLGQVLIKSLMVTLSEMNPPPEAVLFLNSGVMLTCEGSPVLEQLNSLSQKGVALVSCGTCLEYYKLKDSLRAGNIGNMMVINDYLTGSSKVITVA
ncbi:MAG: sulfurtransferase-like selenium metabolism protein YedF [Bacillota bacterium]